MPKTLLIGYGNPDRQDDGVAWHILVAVAGHFKYPLPASWEDGFQPSPDHPTLEIFFCLQLTPELSEVLLKFQRVIFVDAHTGKIPENIHLEIIQPTLQNSPFTHHLTPSTLCYLAQSLFDISIESFLVSIRGYEFGFSHTLSEQSLALRATAVSRIIQLINQS